MAFRPNDLNRQIVDKNGAPAAGGFLSFYEAGTRNLASVFTEENEIGQNPWELDQYGIFSGRLNPGRYDYEIINKNGELIDRGTTEVQAGSATVAVQQESEEAEEVVARGRVVSGKKSGVSSQNRFLEIVKENNENSNAVKIVASGEDPLIYEVGGQRVTISQERIINNPLLGVSGSDLASSISPASGFNNPAGVLLSPVWGNRNQDVYDMPDGALIALGFFQKDGLAIGRGHFQKRGGRSEVTGMMMPFFSGKVPSDSQITRFGQVGFIFGDEQGEIIITKAAREGAGKPAGIGPGDIWWNTKSLQWMQVLPSGDSVTRNLCKIGEIAIFKKIAADDTEGYGTNSDENVAVYGVRSEDSPFEKIKDNNISITTVLKSRIESGETVRELQLRSKSPFAGAAVGGKLVAIAETNLASFDIPEDPADNMTTTLTRHLFLTEESVVEVSEDSPLDMRSLRGGFYARDEMSRYIGSVRVDIENKEGAIKRSVVVSNSPDYEGETGVPMGAIILGAPGSVEPLGVGQKGFFGSSEDVFLEQRFSPESEITKELGVTLADIVNFFSPKDMTSRTSRVPYNTPSEARPAGRSLNSVGLSTLARYQEIDIANLNNDMRIVKMLLERIAGSMIVKTTRE